MKKFPVVFSIFLIAAFSSAASAQLCGSFGVKLNIHDSQFNALKNASVEIVAPDKKADKLPGKSYLRPEHQFKPGDDGVMELRLGEGLILEDDYKLVITAPGYLTQEKTVDFPHCVWLSYDVTMLKNGEKSALVTGAVTLEHGKPVPYAGITFTGADRSEKHVNADQNGHYEIKLKPGDYTVEALRPYHHITKVEKFTVPAGGQAALDLKMKTQSYNEDKQVIIQQQR